MQFKIYDCDFGFTYNGVNYDFTHVNSITVEDPETTSLVRGANAGNTEGIVYTEGLREPKKFTITMVDLSKAIFDLLKTIYKERARIDFYCISRADGSSKIAKNGVLSQQPQQLTVDETADSMNVVLMVHSFDVTEVHKS